MRFVISFLKTAALSNHSDGSEFKITDTEPAPYVPGAGGMAPSGIPSYRPTDDKSQAEQPKSGRAAEKKRALDLAMLGKMADARDANDWMGGAPSQGADTLVSQLKYETGFNNITEDMGYNKTKQKDSPTLRRLKRFRKGAQR